MKPFNLDLLILDKETIRLLGEVTNLAIMIPSTNKFTEDGLFSTEIFGPVGDPRRNISFGYIDLKYPILHPLVYQYLSSLKKLYKDIMNNKEYAIWDSERKDLVKSTPEKGKTGYAFMLEYVDKILYHDNNSDERLFKIKVIKKYTKSNMMLREWLVMPAGLRDYTIDDSGKPTEDEINSLYRKLMATVNTLKSINIKEDELYVIDAIRVKIQNITLEIYEYIRVLLDGKSKFIQGKWSKRAITYGTRNVITAIASPIKNIDDDKPSFNDTIIGLYQFIAGIAPVAKYKIHTKFISKILNPNNDTATLIDPKTMSTINVNIDLNKRDEWLSDEGLDNIIGKMSQDVIKIEPVMIDGYYMLLLYDDGKKIFPVFNTELLDDSYNKKHLRPITYAELFYLSIYDVSNKYPAYLTRFPVADIGGIYPTTLYLKTTVNSRTVTYIESGKEVKLTEYPILTEKFYNSLSPHVSKLAGLGGDYDGDTVSLNIVLTEESIKEIKDYLNNKEFYITPSGELAHSMSIDTIDLVLKHLTT